MPKNYHTTVLILHASQVMLEILQARLQQWVNEELPDVKAGFRQGRGTRDQIVNMCQIIDKAKERYKHLNAEFQRIARRDKKAFLSDQCKEIEENDRMGKTRDL